MTAKAFDFRRPPPSGFEERVTRWLTDAGVVAIKLWPRIMPQPVTLKAVKTESVTAESVISPLTEHDFGMRLSCSANASDDCLLVTTRSLLLALVSASVGTMPTEMPADRELTQIERSLAEHLTKQMLLATLQEAWPVEGGLKFAIAEMGVPQKVSPIPGNDVALWATMEVAGPFGGAHLRMLMPRSGVVQQLVRTTTVETVAKQHTQIETAVREFPVDMSVVLGSVAVPLSRLASLAEGDVLILNQKVHEPLTARIGATDKFNVWPGAIGKKQAVRVESVVRE